MSRPVSAFETLPLSHAASAPNLGQTWAAISRSLFGVALAAMTLLVFVSSAPAQTWTPGDGYIGATLGGAPVFDTDPGSFFGLPTFDGGGAINQMGMEAWVNLAPGTADMIGQEVAFGIAELKGFADTMGLYTTWDGTNHTLIYRVVGGAGPASVTAATIAPNTWTHVAGTYNASSLFAYVNGDESTTAWTGDNGSRFYNANTLGRVTQGVTTGDIDAYLDGQVTGFRVWNAKITPTTTNSEVAFDVSGATGLLGNFQLGTNGTTTALVGSPTGGTMTTTVNTGSVLEYQKNGTGAVTVTVDDFFLNVIDAGTLEIGNGGTVGALVTDVVDNGLLSFNRSNALTHSNVISGTGAVSQVGSGITTLTGANSYTGGTTISGGTLRIGDGATAGSISSTSGVANDGTLVYDRSDNLSESYAITGSGAVTQAGTGTLTLLGTNTYTGATTIETGGTLQVGGGGSVGTISTTSGVANDGALIFDRDNAISAGYVISGTGSVTNAGSGTLTLSEANTYTGTTSITAGGLNLTGSLVSDVIVAAGATVSGSGASTGSLSGAGMVGPGNSPGILEFASLDASAGTDFSFEFTAADPDYSNATASVNDVLRLSDGTTPFTTALTSSSTVNIYLNVDGYTFGDEFRGGFFTDNQSDFIAQVQDASFSYYLKDAGGAVIYNGVNYRDVTSSNWVLTTVPATANFAGGSVNGQVLQVVPEPSSFALAGVALAGLAGAAYRRRRKAAAAAFQSAA